MDVTHFHIEVTCMASCVLDATLRSLRNVLKFPQLRCDSIPQRLCVCAPQDIDPHNIDLRLVQRRL